MECLDLRRSGPLDEIKGGPIEHTREVQLSTGEVRTILRRCQRIQGNPDEPEGVQNG